MITSEELIYNIARMFDEIELTSDEVDAELREAGYDPDEVGARMRAISDAALANCTMLKEQVRH